MGSYALCWLDDFLVGSSKNDIDPAIISLFRASDKRVVSDPAAIVPEKLKHYQESQKEEPELQIVYYEASASLIRDRLDIIGYTLSNAEAAFIEWFKKEKSYLSEYIEEHEEDDQDGLLLLRDHYIKNLKLISDLTPSRWIAALNEIRQSHLEPNYHGRYEGLHENTLIGYMLSNEWYGFPGYDMNVPLRLILEEAKSKEKLIYDVTDLVWSGYLDANDDLV